MSLKKYQLFTVEDFIDDEYFRKWALQPDEHSEAFWQQVFTSLPQQEKTAIEAKQMLQSLNGYFEAEVNNVSIEKAKSSFRKIEKEVKDQDRKIPLLKWAAAASVLFFLGLGGFYFLQTEDSMLSYTTGNGNQMTLLLPDSSEVKLNANSTIKFSSEKWKSAAQREIWLDGEAYFEVRKKSLGTKFIVHAGALKVAVLGTEFNVRSRGEKSEVVLTEGKIELAVADKKIAMKPGDYVSYTKSQQEVKSKKVKASDYYAWKDGMAIFNNTLSEVAKELEILYGVQFDIKNETLKNRKIQLSVSADSLYQVLETLKLLYPEEINIEHQNDQVIIF